MSEACAKNNCSKGLLSDDDVIKEDDYDRLISLPSLYWAWSRFARGKRRRRLVKEFWINLEDNIFKLHDDLAAGKYRHGGYRHFVVSDPKRRDIYAASIRDRVIHQLLANHLDEIYSPKFYRHSYAAQKGKGLSGARKYIASCFRSLSHYDQTWVARLDVRQYFASIDHDRLAQYLYRQIKDKRIMNLFLEIIGSFNVGKLGLPLGNVTSQWLANIYLQELDHYIKHNLGIAKYLRYNDDLIIFGHSREQIWHWIKEIRVFVFNDLFLNIPDDKVFVASGPQKIDLLGLSYNGRRIWLKSQTAKRIKRTLDIKTANFDQNLLDSQCSYWSLS